MAFDLDASVLSEVEFKQFSATVMEEFRKQPDRVSIELWESWKLEQEREALKTLRVAESILSLLEGKGGDVKQ